MASWLKRLFCQHAYRPSPLVVLGTGEPLGWYCTKCGKRARSKPVSDETKAWAKEQAEALGDKELPSRPYGDFRRDVEERRARRDGDG
jgi:hypothetical protein